MKSWKLGVTLLSATIPLVGCNLTDDQKERIGSAEDNVEQIALAPQITKPSADESISGIVDVYVDVDTDDLDKYKSVTLFIEGRPELVDTDYPYEFTFDSYFWSENERISLLAKLDTLKGNQLRSEVLSIPVDSSAKDGISFTFPTKGQQFQNVNEVNLAWTALDSAVSYEYRVNEGEPVEVTSTQSVIALPDLGNYSVQVRATDTNDHTGAWSTTLSFSLNSPNPPSIDNVTKGETPDAFSLTLDVSTEAGEVEVQVSPNSDFANSAPLVVTGTTATKELAAGVYYYRARTINEFGHISAWTAPAEVSIGMFAHALNITTGWYNWDTPVDMVVSAADVTVVSQTGPVKDGTNDEFYVSKYNFQDGPVWGKSFKSIIASPRSIQKTNHGYILTGHGSNYNDGKILHISESGQFLWSKTITSQTGMLDGLETYTRESVKNAVELGDNKYLFIGSSHEYRKTGTWSGELLSKNNIITIFDQTKGTTSEIVVPNPDGGEYSSLMNLLVSDNAVFAAGGYKKDGASSGDSSDDSFQPTQGEDGVVLLTLNKLDGSVLSERTGSGLSNRYEGELVEKDNGDVYVSYTGYQKAAATIFDSNNQSSRFINTAGMEYGHLAKGPNGSVLIVGQSTSSFQKPFVVQYDNGVEVDRQTLDDYTYDLAIKSVVHHPKYGTVVLGTDKGGVGMAGSDSYTVLFNITNDLQHIAPSELFTDYGNW